MEQIKFRVILRDKIFGYERLNKRWEWMVMQLNPDIGERWTEGVLSDAQYKHDQFIGKSDKNSKEIYVNDIVNYAVQRKLCPVCSSKEVESDLRISISQFCPNCGKRTVYKDFITRATVIFEDSSYAYKSDVTEDTYQSWPIHSAATHLEWVEVIGNIHENPSLIPKKIKS